MRLAEQLKASRLDAEDLLSLLTLRSEVETPDGQDIRIDLLSSNQVIRDEQGLNNLYCKLTARNCESQLAFRGDILGPDSLISLFFCRRLSLPMTWRQILNIAAGAGR